MEHKIGVGVVVGLAFAVWLSVYYSKTYTREQRRIILFSFIIPPLGLILSFVYWIYYELKDGENDKILNINDDSTIPNEKFKELKAELIGIDEKIKLVKDSKELDVLNEEEYQRILKSLEVRKVEILDLLKGHERVLKILSENQSKLSKLTDLRNMGVISDEEYDVKFKKLTSGFNEKSKKPTSVDEIEKEIFGE